MKYIKRYQPQPGLQKIIRIGEGDLQMLEISFLTVAVGDSVTYETNHHTEAALIWLGGTAAISSSNIDTATIGKRPDVFGGRAESVYMPPSQSIGICAQEECEIAICTSPASHNGDIVLIKQDDVRVVNLGIENYSRDAHLIIDDRVAAQHLFVGEAYVPSGNWASFPPHRHDHHNPPDELDMEEVYFFRFNPKEGFGIQKIYNDSRSIDETVTLEQNDVVLLPEGYHPTVVAPGYESYYLWAMAGAERGFMRFTEPRHAWIDQ